MVGKRTGETYRLGDPVTVKLVEAAPVAGALRFELLSEGRIDAARATGAPSDPSATNARKHHRRKQTEGTMTRRHRPKLWAQRMTKTERDQSFPDSEPRDAATLMLIDRAEPRAEGPARPPPRRPQIHAGQIRLSRRPHRGARPPDVGGKRTSSRHRRQSCSSASPSQRRLRARACARRRARNCEETGLLLGVKRDEPPAVPGEIWTEFAKAKVHPDLGNIHFIARAITPPRRPRRFDTRFFTADASAIAHKIEGVVGPDSELVELVWMPIEEAATARHADNHRRGAGGTCRPRRRRHGTRPAGAVLFHGRTRILPGTAVNAGKMPLS